MDMGMQSSKQKSPLLYLHMRVGLISQHIHAVLIVADKNQQSTVCFRFRHKGWWLSTANSANLLAARTVITLTHSLQISVYWKMQLRLESKEWWWMFVCYETLYFIIKIFYIRELNLIQNIINIPM